MPDPLLDKIDAADHYVKLYAFNGLAVSMASEIEDTLFWCFVGASGKSWEDAFDTFHHRVNFGRKRAIANEAITSKFADTSDAARWDELNRRLQAHLGEGNSDRNLVSHNAVRHSVYVNGPLESNYTEIKIIQEVVQSKAMVLRKGRTDKKVAARDMKDYCGALIDLYQDLELFAEEALGFPHSHPLRCEHR